MGKMAIGKHALLIGIGDSPALRNHSAPEIRDNYRILRCCDDEVDRMRDLLVERFGFAAEGVRTLKTREATRDAILDAADELVERTGRGDLAVLYYCGHGSRMRDPDDPQGWLETIVPYDTSRWPEENRDVPDLEIARWVQELNVKTPDVTLIFDCCHSGSAGRSAGGGTAMEAPADPHPASDARRWLAGTRGVAKKPRRLRSGWLESRHAVTVAACKAAEHAWELKLEEGRGYRFHGALTYHLVRTLSGAEADTTWRDVLEQVAPQVTAAHLAQHPVLEGDLDRTVFGASRPAGRTMTHSAESLPSAYLPVISVDGEAVELWGGAAQGVPPGSRWTIRPHGSRSREHGEELARVRIEEVRGTTARGRIEQGTADRVQAGQRAFPVEDFDARSSFGGLRSLDNPDPESRLRGRVELRILDRRGEPAAVDPDRGHPVVEAGDTVDFEIESRHDQPLWVSLIEVDGDDGVTVLMPRRGHPTFRRGGLELASGEVLRVGRDYHRTDAGLPQGLPDGFASRAAGGAVGDVAVSCLKLLVTAVPADFEIVEQLYRPDTGTRTVVLAAEDVAKDTDWTVVTRQLGIRRRTSE